MKISKRTKKVYREGRKWSEAEIARFQKLYPKYHNSRLAEMFNRTVNAVKKKARKLCFIAVLPPDFNPSSTVDE